MADVLIVDDDRDMAEITSMVLERAGHRTRRADGGREGLERLREALPDIVVLDVEMPHLDGPSMAHRMSLEDSGMERIPVVLVSGCVDLDATAARVGTPYALAKPYSAERFLATIERALAERRAPRPNARVA